MKVPNCSCKKMLYVGQPTVINIVSGRYNESPLPMLSFSQKYIHLLNRLGQFSTENCSLKGQQCAAKAIDRSFEGGDV